MVWSVNGVPGGNIQVGTITAKGYYQAPAKISALVTVVVTAKDGTVVVQAPVLLSPPLGISPASASLTANRYQGFALIGGNAKDTVIWSVNGVVGGNAQFGTISTTGYYQAPAQVSAAVTVMVTAQDGNAIVTAPVALAPPVTIATTALPNGTTGTAYGATLSATGGFAPYRWSLSSGQLPSGLSLTASGTISGTPAAVGAYPITVQVADATGPQSSAPLSLAVVAPLAVTTATLPGGTTGTAYSAALSATGGFAPYRWSLSSGQLPSGLSLTAAGTIIGTPAAVGAYPMTVQVADSTGQQASAPLSLAVAAPLAVTTSALPNGTTGTAYSATLSATGGFAQYRWSLSSGQLPSGVSLTAAGTISGTPAAVGAYPMTVQVADATGQQASAPLSLAVAAPLAVTTAALPNGTSGTAYTMALSATGGTAPYLWSLSSGQLPSGLSLTTAGTITGTPAVVGAYPITVQVADSAGQQASAPLSLAVAAPLAVTTADLPNGTAGISYAATLSTTGGTPPYTWSLLSGTLPSGISLATLSGMLSGTPLTAGTYNMSVQVTDAAGRQSVKSFNLVVVAMLSITTSCLPNGMVGTPYDATLSTSAGTPPVAWSLRTGQLPPGLALSQTGIITGTPTAAGAYTFTVQATDAAGDTPQQSYTVIIFNPAPLVITNADLLNGKTGTPYLATLSATGGVPPYTWTISSGALPAGLSLNASAGTISGSPAAVGWSDFFSLQVHDSVGNATSLTYSIIVNPTLDQYGGIVGKSCTTTGYFHAEKSGDRWWLCTPSGNQWWMTSLGGATAAGGGCDGSTGQCSNYPTIATGKYADLDVHWGPQQNRRLQLWGFGSVGQLSSGYTHPEATCNGCNGWAGGQQPVKLPVTQTLLVSNYAAINLNNYAGHPVKNMLYGLNKNYKGWPASIMDFQDAEFGHWLDGYLGTNTAVLTYTKSPWTVGLFLDDTDWFWGMGAGPDFHTIPAGHTNSHVGYMTLITSPMQTFNPDPASRGVPVLYTDAKVYSKTAMAAPPSACGPGAPCSLRDYLYQEYQGNITALNSAWGSNYTTFDSSGISVAGEVIGTGDGATTVFTHTLARTPVSPESVLVRIAGVPQGGDCPWWVSACQALANAGTLKGPAGSKILTGESAWASDPYAQDAQGYPAASFWVQVAFHFPTGSGHAPSPSRVVGATYITGNKRLFAVAPPADSGHIATGYDVYIACRLRSSNTPVFGCVGMNDPIPIPTLQATNVPLGTDWGVPSTGLVAGTPIPAAASTLIYANGQMQVEFSGPPARGQLVTIDYVSSGWMYGTGLMDEDGRHTAWVGTNPVCLSAALSCDGADNPLPNSNAQLAADLDGWITQFAAQYFSTCQRSLKKFAPNMMYLGADTVGTWGVPARKEILVGAAPYVDALFTSWLIGLPDAATSNAIYQYLTKYLGDKPLMNFLTLRANPDSSLFRYPFTPVYWAPTQEQRGQMYSDAVNTMLTTQSYNGTYQWVGVNWWGLTDFWPSEKTDFGLLSLSDNAYDGKSAAITVRKDPWGFPTGGEERNYGDAIDYVKSGNSLWWTGLLKGNLPQ